MFLKMISSLDQTSTSRFSRLFKGGLVKGGNIFSLLVYFTSLIYYAFIVLC
ncbi:hypothetical protein LINPERPRIM_LOCUS25156, partial [Linum perenne]